MMYSDAMSVKTRFQVMLEPKQLSAMRQIDLRRDMPVARQIRRAIDLWLEKNALKEVDRTRAARTRVGDRRVKTRRARD
jgi:hypothetical protein